MNKSYDVYMCRERKQTFIAPINNYIPLGCWPEYPKPKQNYFNSVAKSAANKSFHEKGIAQKMLDWLRGKLKPAEAGSDSTS